MPPAGTAQTDVTDTLEEAAYRLGLSSGLLTCTMRLHIFFIDCANAFCLACTVQRMQACNHVSHLFCDLKPTIQVIF